MEECPFKPGDRVRIIHPQNDEAMFGWGPICSGDVGIVTYVGDYTLRHNRYVKEDWKLIVDFPKHRTWNGIASEFEMFEQVNENFLNRLKSISAY